MSEKDKKSWWQGFTAKQRISVIDSDDGHEKWYMYISLSRILIGFLGFVVLVFVAVGLVVAYTPIMDTIPGYPGEKSRERLVQGIMRLDSLEREMAHLTVYSDNIALIMEGKTPIVRDVTKIGDSIKIEEKVMIPPSEADSTLRAQLEGDGQYSLSSVVAGRAQNTKQDLISPVQGLIQSRFNPVKGDYGIVVRTKSDQPVVAIREGSITMSVWTPIEGNIVQIQHPDYMISVYKGISQVQRPLGSRVKGGEIIGVAGETDDEGSETPRPFGFELWYNGTPVDPESYIVF
jgi:murein DD-endopeptidase MepM/ murein hydrolase activator NlpD